MQDLLRRFDRSAETEIEQLADLWRRESSERVRQ